jgi:hypothetical protein
MKKIGELLVEREWLTREQLHQALKHQQVFGGRLGTCLLELSLLTEDRLIKALSDQLGVPPASADDLRVVPDGILELVPAKVACRTRVVPFERFGNTVSVALVDTRDLLVQDELGFVISKRLKVHVAPEVRVLEALEKHYHCHAEARFSRIWDRLNRSRFLWQEEVAASPGTVPEATRQQAAPAGVATLQSIATPAPSWQPAPPPPLESGITRLAAAELAAAERAAPPVAGPPAAPPSPAPAASVPAAPRPSPLLGSGVAVQPPEAPPSAPVSPTVEAKAAPAREVSAHADTSPLVVPRAPKTVAELAGRLAEVTERDDVAHAVLSFLERRFERRLLFMVKGSGMAAWMGSGAGVDQKQLASLDVPFDQPSLFLNLREGSPFYRGPLPRLEAHQRLAKVWGGKYPRECLLLPVRVKGRMVAAVYCDRAGEDLSRVDLGELQQMAAEIGHAFERYLVRKKSRSR